MALTVAEVLGLLGLAGTMVGFVWVRLDTLRTATLASFDTFREAMQESEDAFRTEMRTSSAALREEMHTSFGKLREEMAGVGRDAARGDAGVDCQAA